MQVGMVAAGLLIVFSVTMDALLNTVSVGSGGGWMTTRVGPLPDRSHGACSARVISACGQVRGAILLVSIALWLILTWRGWSLVFAASANAVVDATTAAPATGRPGASVVRTVGSELHR